MSRGYNFCYTLNNYTEEDAVLLSRQGVYSVQGYECGASGTKHIQGYIQFNTQKRLSTLKKIHPRVHWEVQRGTDDQAIAYCKKTGNFKEFGTRKMPGKRNDINECIKLVKENGMKALFNHDKIPNYQVIRICEKYLTYEELSRDWKPSVVWIYGESGAGKSRLAHHLLGPSAYCKDDTKWWDGYDRQDKVLWDDFRAHCCRMTYLLKLLDRYPIRVECKGGSRQFLAKEIVITSINAPDEIYRGESDKEEPHAQLIRRIDYIVMMKSVSEVFVSEVRGNTRPGPLRQVSYQYLL
ncbi:MAG: hypothetical protein QXX12_07065 [Nanopusillaceae archaeon]